MSSVFWILGMCTVYYFLCNTYTHTDKMIPIQYSMYPFLATPHKWRVDCPSRRHWDELSRGCVRIYSCTKEMAVHCEYVHHIVERYIWHWVFMYFPSITSISAFYMHRIDKMYWKTLHASVWCVSIENNRSNQYTMEYMYQDTLY